MSLRPRYSLLTLLILTALVAGGMKWYRGPHHIVYKSKPDQEDEYTYTRGLLGEKIVYGPQVTRFHYHEHRPLQVCISYNRHGQVIPLAYWFLLYTSHDPSLSLELPNNPLTPQEQQEFRLVIEQERKRLMDQGVKGNYVEGFDPYPSRHIVDPKAKATTSNTAP